MSTPQELITDAQVRLTKAEKLLAEGDWQRGVFELGCATSRIIQVVEWLSEHVGDKPPYYRP